MKLWVTKISAYDTKTGQLKIWCGPEVPGLTHKDAEDYCQNHGLGYCKVIGELIAEIPCKPGTHEPDFNKKIDYENLN